MDARQIQSDKVWKTILFEENSSNFSADYYFCYLWVNTYVIFVVVSHLDPHSVAIISPNHSEIKLLRRSLDVGSLLRQIADTFRSIQDFDLEY